MTRADEERRTQSALRYPHEAPGTSYILLGDEHFEVPGAGPRGLRECTGSLVGCDRALGDLLTERGYGCEVLSGRTAALAYGANRSPQVLARKIASCVDRVVPALRVLVRGIDVCYSAHVSSSGIVPATIHRSEGTQVQVFVLLLSQEQLAAVNVTENVGVNYGLEVIDGIEVEFDDGTIYDEVAAYVGLRGAFEHHGAPIALSAIEARERAIPSMDEHGLMGIVARRMLPNADVPELVMRLRSDREFRDSVTARLAKRAVPFGAYRLGASR